MATEPVKKDSAPAAAKPKGKSKLLLIIIIAVVVIGGGAGAWFAFKPGAKPDGAAASAAAKPAAPHAPPLYYKFDPAFVVNFGGEGSARYLQVTVEAMTRDAAAVETLKNIDPAIRNDLVILFSGQDNATLISADGKEKLRAATLAIIRKVLDSEGGNGKLIEAVYFTSFVIQ